MAHISITVNGKVRKGDVEPRTLLVHFLREQLHLTGAHVGCDTSQCGACTVMLDGRSAKSCTVLAVQADGSEVTTIEGLATDGQLHPLQEAFWAEHGLQCGFCTPGMILSAVDLLKNNPHPTERAGARRDFREFLPLHRLSAHRQRDPARRGQRGASHVDHISGPSEARGPARQAPRGSAIDPGPRHVRRRREDSLACSIWRSSDVTSLTRAFARSTRLPRRRCRASRLSTPASRSRSS